MSYLIGFTSNFFARYLELLFILVIAVSGTGIHL